MTLLAMAPFATWAIEAGCARVIGGRSGPAGPGWIGTLAAAALVPVSARLLLGSSIDALLSVPLGWLLVALARIDLRHGLLPDRLTGALAAGGVAIALLQDGGAGDGHPALQAAVAGGLAGFASFALVAAGYRAWRGREGMGLGDAKLLGAGGTWIGWSALPLAVCVAAVAALATVGLARLAGGRFGKDGTIPFGPFLCLALWIVFLVRGGMLP